MPIDLFSDCFRPIYLGLQQEQATATMSIDGSSCSAADDNQHHVPVPHSQPTAYIALKQKPQGRQSNKTMLKKTHSEVKMPITKSLHGLITSKTGVRSADRSAWISHCWITHVGLAYVTESLKRVFV